MASIPYHLEDADGAKLSLVWANERRERTQETEFDKRVSHGPSLREYKSRIVSQTNLEPTQYCLYEATLYAPEFPGDDDTEGLSEGEEAYVTTVLSAFNEIRDDWTEGGDEFEWYKQLDIEQMLRVIDDVEYRQSIPRVGGELLSRFITAHPMPNANHRVAISLLETYLSMYDPNFEMPDTGVTDDWYDWAEEFVFKSKEIMTIARKDGLLRHLYQCGCEEIVRDGNNRIRIDDHDLNVADGWQEYAMGRHMDESIGFVTMVLDRTERPHLLNQNDDGKQAFLERLSV